MMTKKARVVMVSAVLGAVLAASPRDASAANREVWEGGTMHNMIIDLIFWGTFSDSDRQAAQNYINDLTRWMMGITVPAGKYAPLPGFEPAIHYYGPSGIVPGTWVNATTPLGIYAPSGGNISPDRFTIGGIVTKALNGQFGRAYSFCSTVPNCPVANSAGVPSGANRLPIVVTKGTNILNDGLVNVYVPVDGFHVNFDPGGGGEATPDVEGNPFAAVMWDRDGQATMSHEIQEAMTNPINSSVIWDFNGWSSGVKLSFSTSNPANIYEIADQCESQEAQEGIGQVASITLNAPFLWNHAATESCAFWQPEAHAPMAAAVEGTLGGTTVVLDYRMPNGHIGSVHWNSAGQPASATYDLGQPSASVTAVGKPSLIYDSVGGAGEYLFTKGSDAGLWMYHNGGWTDLGGTMFGDPSAVVLEEGQLINVFVLGADDTIYWYGMTPSLPYGWSGVPDSNGTRFLSSPTAISRLPTNLDIFATGEDGSMKWISYSPSTGWVAPTTVSNDAYPYIGPIAAVSQDGGEIDVFGMGEQNGMFHGSWNSSWSSFESYFGWVPPYPATLQGTPAAVSWGSGRLDVFAVDRQTQLWHWTWSFGEWIPSDGQGSSRDRPPLIPGNVIGDPVAISRSVNELELFYREGNGTLGHMTLNGSTWSSSENVAISIW